MADTFICGQCRQTFHDIALFLQHKNECVAVFSDGSPVATLLVSDDAVAAAVDGELTQNLLAAGQQYVVQTTDDGLTGEFTIINGDLNSTGTGQSIANRTRQFVCRDCGIFVFASYLFLAYRYLKLFTFFR